MNQSSNFHEFIKIHIFDVELRAYPSFYLITIRLYAEGENLEPRFGGVHFLSQWLAIKMSLFN